MYERGNQLPAGMNPASWMLDVLGGTDSSQKEGEVGSSTRLRRPRRLLDGARAGEAHFKNVRRGRRRE